MDIEDLNKKQLISIVLFVCFIVSIATSIFTTAALRGSEVTLPQTVNNVIEKTIEKVIFSTSTPAIPTIKETAVEQFTTLFKSASLRRTTLFRTATTTSEVLGNGMMIARGHMIVAGLDMPKELFVQDAGTKTYILFTRTAEKQSLGLSVYTNEKKDIEKDSKTISNTFSVGERVMLYTPKSETIRIGYITGIVTDSPVRGIETDFALTKKDLGAILFSSSLGTMIGVVATVDDTPGIVSLADTLWDSAADGEAKKVTP